MKQALVFSSVLLLTCTSGFVAAQAIDEVTLIAPVGSFRINSNGKLRASGKIRITFQHGSLMLSGMDPKAKVAIVGGTLKEEYSEAKHQRRVFFGKGTLEIEGSFRSIQWFGRGLSMAWKGTGITSLFGEIDAKGNVATYQFKGQPIRYWGTGGATIFMPFTPSENIIPARPAKKID